MLEIIPLPALKKNHNYIWLLKNTVSRHIAIVDPGEAEPLLALIKEQGLIPIAILITHHHWDHVNGITDITAQYDMPVYTPKTESVAGSTHPVGEGDQLSLPELDLTFDILDVPGHTAGAIAYYTNDWVFTGDTLFTAGCGRLFEGTAVQLYNSLQRINALADSTLVYCGHEYTVNNLQFAAQIEPGNTAIQQRLEEARAQRAKDRATIPAPLAIEKQTNPFLRCEEPDVIAAAESYAGQSLTEPSAVFAALRRWKDNF